MKNVRYLFTTFCLVLLTGLAGINGSAIASTPDGQTPANEGVCDPLKADGITKGLYGLCVAYCEAQDLDTVDKEPPNTKILGNYNKKKQAGDPDMPCVKTPCPCWDNSQLASIDMPAACLEGVNTIRILNSGPTHFAFANLDRDLCTYVDVTTTPITANNLTVSPADAQTCFNAVYNKCVAAGLITP
jgi:hypothetical protein